MDPFPFSSSFVCILLTVDYVSKWAKATATQTNDSMVVTQTNDSMVVVDLSEHIFSAGLELLKLLSMTRELTFVTKAWMHCSRNMGLFTRYPLPSTLN